MLGGSPPGSLLDVGCGRGTWLRAALDLGVTDIIGIDGAPISEADFLCHYRYFRRQNLYEPWDLQRQFGLALCLEVAEHLPAESAPGLIASLVKHSEVIFFSAAAPGQPGQHHVNCQWPEYWQEMFNRHGYVCEDTVRWKIWDNVDIEPWYRQNIFMAKRTPEMATREDRIRRVLHPDMLDKFIHVEEKRYRSQIEIGILPVSWYLSLPYKAATSKLKRKLVKD
jgi:SAM-dependent methyltransferase